MRKEHVATVGTAVIEGDVDLDASAPETIECKVGDEILVKAKFQYRELSSLNDGFRILLESKLAGKEAKPAEHVGKDTRGVVDDAWGFVMQRHRVEAAGESTLEYALEVEYREAHRRRRDELAGDILIVASD